MAQSDEKHKDEIVRLERELHASTSRYERQLNEKQMKIRVYQVFMRLTYIFPYQNNTEYITRVWKLIH